MTALRKNTSKGVALAQSVSSVYVAMAGLQSIEVTGQHGVTNDSTTLDGPVTMTNMPNGYTTAPTIKASGFFDPGHATYTSLIPLMGGYISSASLAPAPTLFKITYTDSAPTSDIYYVTGVGVDKKVETSKGIMADISLVTSGDPNAATNVF